MTTDEEQEAFGLVVQRQKSGASENDIRAAFQRFMETASIVALAEATTEGPPGIGNPGRMDLYVHNTCVEFKKDIVRNGLPVRGYIDQLGRVPRKPAQSRHRSAERHPHRWRQLLPASGG